MYQKGLRLKSHRVRPVHEDAGRLVAEIEWSKGRTLACGRCSRRTWRIHSRQPFREGRDLSVRDQPLVSRYAPARVNCPACGPRVEAVPWAHEWQRYLTLLYDLHQVVFDRFHVVQHLNRAVDEV